MLNRAHTHTQEEEDRGPRLFVSQISVKLKSLWSVPAMADKEGRVKLFFFLLLFATIARYLTRLTLASELAAVVGLSQLKQKPGKISLRAR